MHFYRKELDEKKKIVSLVLLEVETCASLMWIVNSKEIR